MNGAYTGILACGRCGTAVAEADAARGCPRCSAEGVFVNVHPVYESPDPLGRKSGGPGIFRYRHVLPIGGAGISLGEGETPLLPLERLGSALGVPELYLKDETRNPTWSYKDRLAAVAVSKAVEMGAEAVVVATTGNHGAAAAAYAAAAGLRCIVLTLESVPVTMKVLMGVFGARLVALRSGPDRWRLMAAAVAERGWFPLSGFHDPPIGSNPFGIEGYKTIAYELVEQLGSAPDVVVVPTAYGDGLAGICRGFLDLRSAGTIGHLPRLVAAEPLGPYSATLQADSETPVAVEPRSSVAFSTATPVATCQGLDALRISRGTAVAVPDDAVILAAQRRYAETEGVYLEAAAALTLPVVERLAETGWIGPEDRVVVVGTSSGLKDVGATAKHLGEVPVIEATLAALDAALEGSEGR